MAGLHEECAVVGMTGAEEAARYIYLALYALQHRGQEASGIVLLDHTGKFNGHKDFGLVSDVFDKNTIAHLNGSIGIGHNRYSTQGGKLVQNIQPFSFNTALGPLAIAHNGNLTNAHLLRSELEQAGSIFQSTSDSEIFMHLIAKHPANSILERIKGVMKQVKGAYSLLLLTGDALFAVRDPFGFRPLVYGKKDSGHMIASETCALDLIGAQVVREIEPGEILEFKHSGQVLSHPTGSADKQGFCSFEPIYFARPDSRIFGDEIYQMRKKMGRLLAEETAVQADIVIAVPDSGVPMALGYAEASGIAYEVGLVRNHYVGRTFIEPSQSIRDFGVKLKLNPVLSVLKDRRVVVVDDSIVRGTTSAKIVRMIKSAGAREIHMRVGSPPITHSCYFGVDTPERKYLLAAQKNVDEIRDFIGCDSLGFLSISGMKKSLGKTCDRYCFGCFEGKYPEEICRSISSEPTDARGGPGLVSGKKR